MPILDNKGRLFGRINIIDLTALVLILVVLAVAVGSRIRGGTLTQNVRFMHREAPVVLTLVPRRDVSFLADQIQAGDSRRDSEGVMAQVLRVERGESANDPVRLEIWLRARISSEGERMYQIRRLGVGRPIRLEMEDYQVHGYIEAVEEAGPSPE